MMNKNIAVDSLVLLCGAEGVADSGILTGFRSMIEAEAVSRARASGYGIPSEYCSSGEFGIDIIGETGLCPQALTGVRYQPQLAKKLLSGEASAALTLDVNGSPRRTAAVCGLVNLKPTYGTVSRYGVVPVASSADTVSVTAKTAMDCAELLRVISGRDEKDATTVSDALCPLKNGGDGTPVRRLGVPFQLLNGVDESMEEDVFDAISALNSVGVETVDISCEDKLFTVAHAAWNTILCGEARGNLSRYDGVRFGKRAEGYGDLGEVYVSSRSEGFGSLVKSAILYGSRALSTEYGGEYFKALRVRSWVKSELERLFKDIDGIVMPVCSVPFYTEKIIESWGFTAFNENFYTSLASLCGLPAVTSRGVQIIGKPFSDSGLATLAECFKL